MANLALGIVVIVGVVWVSRRYAERLRDSGLERKLAEELAGPSVTKAVAVVDDLRAFEAEA